MTYKQRQDELWNLNMHQHNLKVIMELIDKEVQKAYVAGREDAKGMSSNPLNPPPQRLHGFTNKEPFSAEVAANLYSKEQGFKV